MLAAMVKTTASKKSSSLPAALAKRATAAHAARLARLARAGRNAIAKVRDARTQIAGTYFDVGEALVARVGELLLGPVFLLFVFRGGGAGELGSGEKERERVKGEVFFYVVVVVRPGFL